MEILLGQSGEHQDGVVRINYKSDFPLEVKVVRNGVVENFPDADFTLTAKTEGGFTVYKAERKAGVYSHCKRDGERLIMFFDNHGLAKGKLIVSAVINHPDADYTEDGIRQENLTSTTNIELVEDNGDALQLQLPEPRVVEKVVEKEITLPAEIKELSEAVSKVMEYNPEAGSEGLFNGDEVFNALVAQKLLECPRTILHNGELVTKVNKFINNLGNTLADEIPFMEQISRIALLKAYAQSNGIPISPGIFCGVYLNQLNLTLREPIDIQRMFAASHICQLRIYLTEDFEIAKDGAVTVNGYSSHEEWVNYRNSDNSEEMTQYRDGYIKYFHLKFDANKQEQAITLIRNLGFGAVKNIYLEATEPIDGETFHRWLVEALKPYTDNMKTIRDINGNVFKPSIFMTGGKFGINDGNSSTFAAAYIKKGYDINTYAPIDVL